jgi:hypothetical protein
MQFDETGTSGMQPWTVFDVSPTGGWIFIGVTLLAIAMTLCAVIQFRQRVPNASEYMMSAMPLLVACTSTFCALSVFYENWQISMDYHAQSPESLSRNMMFFAGAFRLAFVGGVVTITLLVLLSLASAFHRAKHKDCSRSKTELGSI